VAIVWRCLHDPAVSRFGAVPACDRRTDTQAPIQVRLSPNFVSHTLGHGGKDE